MRSGEALLELLLVVDNWCVSALRLVFASFFLVLLFLYYIVAITDRFDPLHRHGDHLFDRGQTKRQRDEGEAG